MRAIAAGANSGFLKEQFIPDHVFLYVLKGEIAFYDADERYTLQAGECGIARKNHLAKFLVNDKSFEPVLFCFDEAFLRAFQQKHQIRASSQTMPALIKIDQMQMIPEFVRSIKPYYKGVMELDEAFEDVKYEELLILLLKNQPELAGVFFDFALPHKIDLETFMNKNYRFNVSLQRFAFLTGRSLSAFKRDFQQIFKETPGHWLTRRRLQEAHVLIGQQQRPSDIYLGLGFESLSHFSVAYKKQYGHAPNHLS